jgi:hypothetical protein
VIVVFVAIVLGPDRIVVALVFLQHRPGPG